MANPQNRTGHALPVPPVRRVVPGKPYPGLDFWLMATPRKIAPTADATPGHVYPDRTGQNPDQSLNHVGVPGQGVWDQQISGKPPDI